MAQPTMADLARVAGGMPSQGNGRIWDAGQAAALMQQGFDINSLMAGWVDRGAWLYYDRIYQSSTSTYGGTAGTLAQTYSAFSIGLNKPDAITSSYNKTKLFTNMPNSGQFNPPRCMVLRRLAFYFEPTMFTVDMKTFMQNAYIEFKIDDKIFFEGLIEFWPAGMGLTGFSNASGDKAVTNGLATPGAMRDYGNYAKYIAPLQNFSLTLNLPAISPYTGAAPALDSNGTGLNLVCIMDGLTDRSVQ